MSRWWRAYDDALNDPKVQALHPTVFKFWFNILCVASKYDGVIPPVAELKTLLKARLDHVEAHLSTLLSVGLIDDVGGVMRPHNWDKRQYKSDTSTERVKDHRGKKKQECNVSETPPDNRVQNTDTEREKESAALRAPPAPAIVRRETKHRAKARAPLPDLWTISEVERTYAKERGFADGQIASMATAFENHHRAKGSLMADWTAAWRTWCENEIKFNRGNGNGFGGSRPLQNAGSSNSVVDASDRLIEKLRAFDEPAPSDLRSGEGQASLRLISKG